LTPPLRFGEGVGGRGSLVPQEPPSPPTPLPVGRGEQESRLPLSVSGRGSLPGEGFFSSDQGRWPGGGLIPGGGGPGRGRVIPGGGPCCRRRLGRYIRDKVVSMLCSSISGS